VLVRFLGDSTIDSRVVVRAVWFRLASDLRRVEVIVTGRSIRDLTRLCKIHGVARWRKLKGIASVELADGSVSKAELHWYEAHGIGRRDMKIKRILGDPWRS
jgi:hypothetical protein